MTNAGDRPGPWAQRSWAERNPLAADLDRRLPSPALAALVDGLDPVGLDDESLIEAIGACERLAGWVAERQARFVAALADRAQGSLVDRVPDEVATRLGISRRAGEARVELAIGLRAHPPLADALAEGAISVRKAEVLLHHTDHLPDPLAARVIDRVLPGAETRTVPQLRRDVRTAALGLDPDAAAARHVRARAERCVRMGPAPDAMAWIHALLPAADAVTVMTALDAVTARREPGETRTADQRRADALTSLTRRLLDSGVDMDGAPVSTRQHRRPHLVITVSPQVPGVAHLAGYGPVPVAAVAHLAETATTAHVPVDDDGVPAGSAARTDAYRPSAQLAGDIVDRDRTCRFPGCQVPAVRCDIDHIVPFDPTRPARWQTVPANLQALCRHHHRIKTHTRWYVSRDPISGATLWRSPTGRIHVVSPEPAVPGAPSPSGARAGPATAGAAGPGASRLDGQDPESLRAGGLGGVEALPAEPVRE